MQTTYRQPGAATTEPTVWIDDGGPDPATPARTFDRNRWPAGKLADVELRWTAGTLEGLKLAGFTLWEARTDRTRVNVTFPARQYSVNGERRSFALVRDVTPATGTADPWTGGAGRLRALILEAWEMHQERSQPDTSSTRNRPARFAPSYADPLTTGQQTTAPGADPQLGQDDDPAQAPQPTRPALYTGRSTYDDASTEAPYPAEHRKPLDFPPAPVAVPAPRNLVTGDPLCNRCGQPTDPADLQDHDLGGVYVRACAPCRQQLAQPIATRTAAYKASLRSPNAPPAAQVRKEQTQRRAARF